MLGLQELQRLTAISFVDPKCELRFISQFNAALHLFTQEGFYNGQHRYSSSLYNIAVLAKGQQKDKLTE